MAVKEISLSEWIDREGRVTVAKACRVTTSSVGHWRRGYVCPRADEMMRIEKLSRGAVTVDSIVKGFCSPKNKKNRSNYLKKK